MKIYLAGPWAHKDHVSDVADWLRSKGFELTSHWHDTDFDSNIYEAPKKIMREEAEKDFNDLNAADTLIYLNLKKSEGKATELGIALAKGYPIYVVGGTDNNVFLHLPVINHKESLDEVVNCLLT